ncbi:hypothetical protein TIFTF001_038498 [Ficus carica]|uniref:Uncharacterized protein n=1 Tax=Ficus carica TaxID=3494 RepID=A0AA88E8Y3_FICCA|nr:hypothetical protein TIFTF001_038498 [Ficus carica]
MAETAVGLVVDKLIPLLTEEAHLLRGVHTEVEDIKCDLEFLLAFLKDADAGAEKDQRPISSHGVKVWVEKLRKEAFEVEDAIDEYTHLMVQQRRPHKHRFISFLRRNACLIIKLKSRHDIASKIQEIKRRVQNINDKSTAYGFNSTQARSATTENKTWYDPRTDSCFLQENEVVGIQSTRDKLIAFVEDESPQRSVISLVGMGGLGKTTLAHQVYVRVKGRFDCHAWIEVSRSYNKVELLRNLLRKFCQARKEPFPAGIDVMDQCTLTEKIRDYLQGKSYCVVFDDVWNPTFWADIKNALPDQNEKLGRTIFTTRVVTVADFCKESAVVHIHELRPLPPDTAWELFCNRAFKYDFQGRCPTNLEKLSHEILQRCDGLPLAIVVIAGLLSTKDKNANEWEKFLSTLSSEMESNESLASIEKILSLSYYDLPYYLKSCFLYFGCFPEDYSIRRRRLIRQWIAEGFVNPKKDKTLEVVAEEYLADLINRSMVQVSELDFDGKPKSCKIHDLLREIVLKKMVDSHFSEVMSSSDSKFRELARRVSVPDISGVDMGSSSKTYQVRSLYMFVKDKIPTSFVSTISKNFKLLKVLDFEDTPSLDHLPEDIGILFHLRYLSVRGTQVGFLPTSIGKLENLETLDLKQSLVYELPVQINKLHKLRHLLAYNIDQKADFHINRQRGIKVKKGIGRLKALKKLYFLEADTVGADVLEELSELTELRKLGIKKLRNEDGKTLCGSIQKMEHLESLDICSISENETLDLESMSSSPKFLQRLWLKGHLGKLPEWIIELQNLIRINIAWSKLEDDPVKALQNLPNLLELVISGDAYYGEKMHFEQGAFPKLKVLHLRDLSKLNSMVIEEGALCNLESFEIGPCPQLKEVPSGFQHLRNLERLLFVKMPAHFLMFQNFQSVQTIPQVGFIFFLSGEWYRLALKDISKLQSYIQAHNEVDWNSLPFEEVWNKVVKKCLTCGRHSVVGL